MDSRHYSVFVFRTELLRCVNRLWPFVSYKLAGDNQNKSLYQQQQKRELLFDLSSSPVSEITPLRRSLKFLDELQLASSIPVQPPTPARSHTVSSRRSVSEKDAPEDLMVAFHDLKLQRFNLPHYNPGVVLDVRILQPEPILPVVNRKELVPSLWDIQVFL